VSKPEEVAIKVSHVSKSFKLPHEKNTTIKSFAINPFRKRTFEKQEVLKDIDFEIKKGEFFGIVGRNGSGKSTLLKILAGIYSPNKGNINVNGKLTPFIELGVGFNHELSGRENVFLNGALLGFNRKEMEAMYDDIVEFAELSRFMDQKLKNYSSGMQVRLAFSIAIRADSEILVLDEVLAVGDEAFQEKCIKVFQEYRNNPLKTVILVTHGMDQVEKFCNRALLLENSRVEYVGDPKVVAKKYNILNNSTTPLTNIKSKVAGTNSLADAMITKFEISQRNPDLSTNLKIDITAHNKTNKSTKVVIGVNINKINDPYNSCNVEYNSYLEVGDTKLDPGQTKKFELILNKGQFYRGDYIIRPHVLDVDDDYRFHTSKLLKEFTVIDTHVSKSGSFNLMGKWSMKNE
jgi:ABC-type polysaccharide/polyol phosphate transport system ATPase subunit